MNIDHNTLICISKNISFLLKNSNINTFIITIIAGIFGFIIASIPITIQIMETKNNENIDRINSNQIVRKGIFNNYFDVLESAFLLSTFLILLNIIYLPFIINILSEFNIIVIVVIKLIILISYGLLSYYFFRNLYKLIGILRNLVDIYLKFK